MLADSQIIIKRSERTKRKQQTHIQNLELFGIELKAAAKLFASRFATGSSVSKNPQGQDEIVVQGDVGDEIVSISSSTAVSHELTPQVEMIRQQKGVLKGAPVDQIERVVVKKKKEPEPEA